MGVTVDTLINWEKDRVEPEIRYWPNIIAFLGYDPHPAPQSLGERLRTRYREMGLARKRAASRLRIDEGTLAKYESGEWTPKGARLERIMIFIG